MHQNDERRLTSAAATTSAEPNPSNGSGLPRLLTAAELGDLLALTAGTILDRFERGDLPGYRLWGKKGGPVRFRVSEVELWLASCRVDARDRPSP